MKLQNLFNASRRWLSATPERALDAAYRAAIKIKAIEDDHFDGQIVSAESVGYSESVIKVFQGDVNSYLSTIKARLAEFKLSRSLLIFSNTRPNNSSQSIVRYTDGFDDTREPTVIEKLAFIDAITFKYKNPAVEEIEISATRRLDNSQKDNRLIRNSNVKISKKDIPLSDLYTFSISPYDLLDISHVYRRDELPSLQDSTYNYQRPLERKKL